MSFSAPRRDVLRYLAAGGLGVGLGAQALPVLAAGTADAEAGDSAYALAYEAFLYGYPLVHLGRWRDFRIKVGDPVARTKLRWGAWTHRTATVHPRSPGAPQTDTLYSFTFLDLKKEPYLLGVPDLKRRYWSIQLTDMLGETFGVANRRNMPRGGLIAIVGPEWTGSLPANVMQVYRCPMNTAFALSRLYFESDADQPRAVALQTAYTSKPLSVHLAGVDWNGTVPAEFHTDPLKDDPLADFRTLQLMWNEVAPYVGDPVHVERFKPLGLCTGQVGFDHLPEATRAAMARTQQDVRAKVAATFNNIYGVKTANHWTLVKPTIGLYDDGDYLYRAAIALGTIGTPITENVYANYQANPDGTRLNGSNSYVLRFASGQFPPCTSFWSLHAYTFTNGYTLIDNPINRYAINERVPGLQYDADGGLTVYIQADSPGPDKQNNWLPTRKGEDFWLIVRGYEPRGDLRNLTWAGPELRRVG